MTVPPPAARRCPVEGSLAAYTLGALRGDELAQVEAHLDDCPECSEALAEFSGLPALLDLLEPGEAMAGPPVPANDQLDRLLSAAGRERRTSRYRRLAAVAAAIVLVAAVGVGWVAGRETAPSSFPVPTRVSGENRALNAEVTMAEFTAGTHLSLRVSGITGRHDCRLVAIAKDGRREVAASWNAEYAGDAVIEGTTGIPRGQLSTLDIVTPQGQTLMTMPVTS